VHVLGGATGGPWAVARGASQATGPSTPAGCRGAAWGCRTNAPFFACLAGPVQTAQSGTGGVVTTSTPAPIRAGCEHKLCQRAHAAAALPPQWKCETPKHVSREVTIVAQSAQLQLCMTICSRSSELRVAVDRSLGAMPYRSAGSLRFNPTTLVLLLLRLLELCNFEPTRFYR
jgi:hypothetical protein